MATEVKPGLKNMAKALLEQDHTRKQAAKWRNTSYEPWKKGVQTVKDTPFGAFNGSKPKANAFLSKPFDFTSPKKEPDLAQGSINVRRRFAFIHSTGSSSSQEKS